MKNKAFNWLLNAISLVCAAIIVWQFAHRQWGDSAQHPSAGARVGSRVALRDVSWRGHQRTLVLAISTSCPYCRASAGFYRALIAAAKPKGVRIIAVLPEAPATYLPLLPALGVDGVSETRQADLTAFGVAATPTILLVDDKAIVRTSWIGALATSQEREVFQKLGLRYASSAEPVATAPPEDSGPSTVSAGQLKALLARPDTVVIDSRDRSDFDEAHITGSLNIPLDEIEERSPHELPRDKPLVLFCHYQSTCEAQKHDQGTTSLCTATDLWLKNAGFSDVRHIAADLCTLADAGIKVTGFPVR